MKKRVRAKLVLVLLLLAVSISFGIKEMEQNGIATISGETRAVASKELAGYLAVIPLTPQETRTLILPELGEYLTGKDIRVLFDKIGLASCYEEAVSVAGFEENKLLTRGQWTRTFEYMLDKLGMREQVSEMKIQYLGDVSEENHIITDQGNFDCDLESCTFTYGKIYQVYLYGNFVLGQKGGDDGNEKDAAETRAGSGDGTEPDDSQQQTPETSAELGAPSQVRILITQDQSGEVYRSGVWVSSGGEFQAACGEKTEHFGGNSIADCRKLMDTWQTNVLTLSALEKNRLYLADEAGNKKSDGYRGKFTVYRDSSGYYVVNELAMQAYLYGVVPGEMPSDFSLEALKAQAVCARTYACRQIAGKRYEAYHADLNDTTDCQVYRPAKENGPAKQAVKETNGQILAYNGNYARTYYYSTSCGYTTGLEVWQQEQVPYLKAVSLAVDNGSMGDFERFIRKKDIEAYDSDSHFFRWKASINIKKYSGRLRKALQIYAQNPGKKLQIQNKSGEIVTDCSGLGACRKIEIQGRAESGAVTDLTLIFSKGTVHIYNENTIRTVLAAAMTSLKDKDGKTADALGMLPSAMFAAEKRGGGRYLLYGGGFGHGIGMSQYAANGMAKSGMNFQQILEKFFEGTNLVQGQES